ncbi:MAG: YciI family protein [Actinomycetota bacterium]
MKYLLLAYGNEEKFNRLDEEEMNTLIERCTAYDEEFRATGQVIGGGSLSWESKSLRLNGGKLSVTDGPYVETKEVVGGLVILEAADWDEAVRLASLHPAARMGEELGWAIELRPMEKCILRQCALEAQSTIVAG